MKTFRLLLLSACILMNAPWLDVRAQSKSESTEKVEVTNPEELILGIWEIVDVKIELHEDELPENVRSQLEKDREMFETMLAKLEENMEGEAMIFKGNGTMTGYKTKKTEYSIIDGGKTLKTGEREDQIMKIVSISEEKMMLSISQDGIYIGLDLSKTGDAEEADKFEIVEEAREEVKQERKAEKDVAVSSSPRTRSDAQDVIVGSWDLLYLHVELDYDNLPANQRDQLLENQKLAESMVDDIRTQMYSKDHSMTFNDDGTYTSSRGTSNYEISEDAKMLITEGDSPDFLIDRIHSNYMTLFIENPPGVIIKLSLKKLD